MELEEFREKISKIGKPVMLSGYKVWVVDTKNHSDFFYIRTAEKMYVPEMVIIFSDFIKSIDIPYNEVRAIEIQDIVGIE